MEEITPEGPKKNDHFVPQLLLRKFVGADKRLAVYDRGAQAVRKKRSVPKKSASEMGWDRYFNGGEARETNYQEIENDFGSLLNDHLVNGTVPGGKDARVKLRKFIAAQIVRSRRYRQRFDLITRENLAHLDQANIPDAFRRKYRQEGNVIIYPGNEGLARAEVASSHYASLFLGLYDSRITIARACPGQRFHIGDSPVAPITGSPIFTPRHARGIWDNPGFTYVLPISSEYVLLVMGREFLEGIQNFDSAGTDFLSGVSSRTIIDSFHSGKAFDLGIKSTLLLNHLQDLVATNFIYSAEASDFDLTAARITVTKPKWRQEIDQDTPTSVIIARLEAMGKSYQRRRERKRRVQYAPLTTWS